MTSEITSALLWYGIFLLSTVLHEAAHGLVALWGGDRTAFLEKQVSMNPIPFIKREPAGMLVIPVLSVMLQGWVIGWGSTPYSPNWAKAFPRRAAFMSLAGPAANLTLAGAAFGYAYPKVSSGIWQISAQLNFESLFYSLNPADSGLVRIISITLSLNLILAVFNLIPIPPLDGSGALGLILPKKTYSHFQEKARKPTARILGLLAAWYCLDYLISPVFQTVLSFLS
ncbi:MAG: site-2 protease family protein [Myxococcota bacterium]|nr:site-2 protease family protein [Myxococcota bacterium]